MIHPLIQSLQDTARALETASPAEKDALMLRATSLVDAMAADLADMGDVACTFLDQQLPSVNAQMEAADKRTEKAADAILTACEKMGPLLQSCPEPVRTQLQDQINHIFEASNFQDLVSQHINEIRRVMSALAEDLGDIRESLQQSVIGAGPVAKREKKVRTERTDAHLLNGPSTNVD